MVYKRFRLQIILRVVLISITCWVSVQLFSNKDYLVTAIVLAFVAGLQTVSLILYAERTNRKLAKFLQSIRHADFVSSFSDRGLGKSFDELSQEFNAVISEFKKNRAEKEENYNYLLTVVQHVSVGIIVFSRDGRVDAYNNATKRLLKMAHLRFVDDLGKAHPELPELLMQLRAGQKQLFKIFINEELLQLSIHATEFRMRGEDYVLVSLQDIHPELEEKEIESWQKLIRVLTHEIMNSITPISSLAETIQEMLTDQDNRVVDFQKLSPDDQESIAFAIKTIENRSKGLLNFVETYRNLTRIPKPNFRHFQLSEMFDRITELMKPKTSAFNIICQKKIFPEDLKLLADPDMVEQVFINLLLNAIDAVKEQSHPHINITASNNLNNRTIIEITDNGSGIQPDIMDKIFMPFFTSKKHGSGIGLSLSRQIMHLHKGSITVKSKVGEGSTFTLTF